MKTAPKIFVVAAVCWLLTFTTFAEVRLPKIFTDHMVLQQDKPVILWGWADPGETVTAQILQQKQATKANDKGEWKLTLPPLKAGGPIEIIVTGSNTIKLTDVLVGEVWVCSGQSNMEMGIKAVQNGDQEIAAADHPNIRLFLIPKTACALPTNDVNAAWKVCTPTSVAEGGWGGFSAAAYFFGREIHKTLGVPVGLIGTSWGGTRIEPWTPPEGFAEVPSLKHIYERVMTANPTTAQHKQRVEQLLAETAQWMETTRKALQNETLIPPLPAYPVELQPLQGHGAPTALYNGMVHPIVPFPVRGALWYQGESNHTEKDYTDKTRALIAGWRKVWGQPDMPFYYVQIAPFLYGNESPNILPEFWEQQYNALAIPHTGMAVIYDVGDTKDIHPRNKQEVGRRLALLALAKTYGKTGLVCSGPTFKDFSIEGDKIRVRFDNIGTGLASRDGKPLTWFEIIDAEQGGWVKANAEISGPSVVLSAPGVTKPVAVRFGWHKLAEPNLMNKEGLPAVQFRAGNPPTRDLLTLHVPEAKDYTLVYDLDLTRNNGKIVYVTDNHASLKSPFDRIAYFLELQPPSGETQYLYVSMDAFTTDPGKIGVPTVESKACFQQNVKNMNVISNVKGIVTGEGLSGGNIEFWPNNYGPTNAKKVPNASDAVWDFGDEIAQPLAGYGSMQVHNHDAKQTLFAFNNWNAGPGADLGIGNSTGQNPDWTFARNAASYTVKRLRVLVRCK